MSDTNQQPNSSPASRREFLKTSTLAATAASLTATLGALPRAYAAESGLLKIALIGCGGRGTSACGQALRTAGDVKLVAIADAFEDNLQSALKCCHSGDGCWRSAAGS